METKQGRVNNPAKVALESKEGSVLLALYTAWELKSFNKEPTTITAIVNLHSRDQNISTRFANVKQPIPILDSLKAMGLVKYTKKHVIGTKYYGLSIDLTEEGIRKGSQLNEMGIRKGFESQEKTDPNTESVVKGKIKLRK